MVAPRQPPQLRVLVLETDAHDAARFVACVNEAGFAVDADLAKSIADAEGYARTHTYGLILCAYRFDGAPWSESLTRLRARGSTAPLIVIGDAIGDEQAVDVVRDGAADFVLRTNLARLTSAAARNVGAHDPVVDAQARFQKLIDAIFDGVAVTEEGVIQQVNAGFLALFGYESPDEVIGRHVSQFTAPESRDVVDRQITSQFDGTYEFVGQRKSGSTMQIEATARSHTVGARTGRITALRNVGAQRELEAQYRQAQRMEAIGRLAGGIAHDFNNLLTVIGSFAEMLHQDMGASDPRRADVQQIRSATQAAADLTRQLLAFSRQEVIQPRVLELDSVAAAMDKMLERVIGEDIRLTMRLQAVGRQIRIDPGQVEHILMNLVVNARDAMPQGGQLTVETAEVMFDESYTRTHWPAVAGKYVMLAVTDTGEGMPESVRARVFEPFFTTKEAGKGTGLGLATVYGMVKQNGGFVWVYSEVGEGTTVKIYLPLATDAAIEPARELVPAPIPQGNETVLLVEDAPALRRAARIMLERLGYHVIEAASAMEALRIVASANKEIDLLLTDVVMPNVSGSALAEQLSSLRPDVKVLFMSGYTDDSIVRHGVLSSTAAYLQKPFTSETLARKVRETLDAPTHAGSAH